MKLGPITNLNVIFHVVVSVYRLVKTCNSPQFPAQYFRVKGRVTGARFKTEVKFLSLI